MWAHVLCHVNAPNMIPIVMMLVMFELLRPQLASGLTRQRVLQVKKHSFDLKIQYCKSELYLVADLAAKISKGW